MSSHLRPTLVRLHLLSSSLPSTSSSSTRAKASKEEKSKGKSSTICSLMQIMIVRKSSLEKRETAAAAVVSWISFHSGQLHRDGATLMASNQSKIQRQRQRQRRHHNCFNQSINQQDKDKDKHKHKDGATSVSINCSKNCFCSHVLIHEMIMIVSELIRVPHFISTKEQNVLLKVIQAAYIQIVTCSAQCGVNTGCRCNNVRSSFKLKPIPNY